METVAALLEHCLAKSEVLSLVMASQPSGTLLSVLKKVSQKNTFLAYFTGLGSIELPLIFNSGPVITFALWMPLCRSSQKLYVLSRLPITQEFNSCYEWSSWRFWCMCYYRPFYNLHPGHRLFWRLIRSTKILGLAAFARFWFAAQSTAPAGWWPMICRV